MFHISSMLAGLLLILTLIGSPVTLAQTNERPGTEVVTEVPMEVPDGVLGYYTTDGGKSFIPIKEEKGVAEKMPSNISKEEFMEKYRMPPESEKTIIHQVPPVPVIIDGTLYQPEEIHRFDGKQLGFTAGPDGRLYAFTSFSNLNNFLNKESHVSPMASRSEFSYFYEYYNYLPLGYWMQILPSSTLFTLAPMNEMISSMEVSPFADNGITLFDLPNLQGDYFHGYYGTLYPNLGTYGWNDRASSLVVWPQ
jgi:hypothetical protein